MALLRRFVGRHVGVLLASLVLGLVALFAFGQPPRRRVVLPPLDGRIVEFSPDSRTLLTDGASGGCVRDAATGHILATLRRKDNTRATNMTCPRFTPDGKRLIVQLGGTRFGDNLTHTVTLALFDAATGRELAAFEPVGADAGKNYGPEYALSADGSTLAFMPKPDDSRGTMIVAWDVDAGKKLAEFPGLPPLALSRDGRMIAHGDIDQDCVSPRIRILRPGRVASERPSVFPPLRSVNCGPLTFSPDDRKLTILPRSRPNLGQLRHVGQPLTLDVAEILRTPATPENKPATPRAGSRIIHDRPPIMFGGYLNIAISLSRDAKLLFVGIPFDSIGWPQTQVWDLTGRSPVLANVGHAEAVAPDAGRAVTAIYNMIARWDPESTDNSDVKVFDLPSSTPRLNFKETGVHAAAISPDGKLLALPSHRRERTGGSLPGNILLSVCRVVGFNPIWLIGFGRSVEIDEVRLYNAATGRFLAAFPLRQERTLPLLEFSPDSRTLIVRYFAPTYINSTARPMNDWSVELWDIPTSLAHGRSSGIFFTIAAALLLAGATFDWFRRGGRRRFS